MSAGGKGGWRAEREKDDEDAWDDLDYKDASGGRRPGRTAHAAAAAAGPSSGGAGAGHDDDEKGRPKAAAPTAAATPAGRKDLTLGYSVDELKRDPFAELGQKNDEIAASLARARAHLSAAAGGRNARWQDAHTELKSVRGLLAVQKQRVDDRRPLRRDNARKYDTVVQALSRLFGDYERLVQEVVQRETADVARARTAAVAPPPLPARPGSAQMLAMAGPSSSAVHDMAQELVEREAAVAQLQNDIAELAVIFRDLQGRAGMRQQREASALAGTPDRKVQLDTIESNVQEAAKSSSAAVVDIQKASESQKRARRKKLWLLGLCLCLVVIAVIAIVVPLTRH